MTPKRAKQNGLLLILDTLEMTPVIPPGLILVLRINV